MLVHCLGARCGKGKTWAQGGESDQGSVEGAGGAWAAQGRDKTGEMENMISGRLRAIWVGD